MTGKKDFICLVIPVGPTVRLCVEGMRSSSFHELGGATGVGLAEWGPGWLGLQTLAHGDLPDKEQFDENLHRLSY